MFVDWEIHPQLRTNMNISACKKNIYSHSNSKLSIDISVFDKVIWHSIAQRAFYLALHSSFFGPDGIVNYDYIVTNQHLLFVNWLKMYSQWHTR